MSNDENKAAEAANTNAAETAGAGDAGAAANTGAAAEPGKLDHLKEELQTFIDETEAEAEAILKWVESKL